LHGRFVTLAGALAWLLAGSAQAAWYNASWGYRKTLTLNGSLVPAAQANYPVLVSFTDPHLGANTQVSGNDILFTAADGTTKLAHELESYTSPAGTIVAWVSVPALASGSNTTIYLYYGNPAAANQQNPTAVWGAGYRGVWHLKEAIGGAGAIKNSTANAGLDGTDVNNPTLHAAGQIDGAVGFDGTSDRRIAVTDPGAGSVLDFASGASVTLSAWIRPQTLSGFQAIVLKGDTATFGSGLNYGLQTANNQLFFSFSTSGSPFSYNNYTTSSSGMTAGNWYYVTCTYTFGNAASAVLYVNGTPRAASWTSGNGNNAPLQSNDQLWLGDDDASETFNGLVDEIRISNVVRSATWIQTEYNNVANQGIGPGKFILSAAPDAALCCGLATTETATTVTVTGANQFELRFNALGGGIDRFFDLAEDPTRTYDLAGGQYLQQLLKEDEIEDVSTYYYPEDSNGNAYLLESTPTRVRVRQDSRYLDAPTRSTYLAGAHAFVDYALYPSGRVATHTSRKTTHRCLLSAPGRTTPRPAC
jgi:hypothetical protein